MLDERLQAFQRGLAPAPLQRIDDAEWAAHGVELWLKRDDLLHPVVSGNKWRKLKWALNAALQAEARVLVSMGGAYSNYLHALAYLCDYLKLPCRGYVRWDAERPDTPTLLDMQQWQMGVVRVSRSFYRQLRDQPPLLAGGEWWLPEGGSQQWALRGVAECVAEVDQAFDVWVCACGTGATLAGLISAVPSSCRVLGIAALKHGDFLYHDVRQLLTEAVNVDWSIDLQSHLGGFAVVNSELLHFVQAFEQRHGVAIEPVYTGKMLLALYRLLKQGYFRRGQRVVALHSGGLQGRRGFAGQLA